MMMMRAASRPLAPLSRRPAHALLRRGIITGPRFTSIVQGLPSIVPFVAPEEMERSRGKPYSVRLGANELTLGPSPKAVEAMRDAAADVWKYGDPKSHELRAALADFHGVQPLNVVVGEGIDGLLAYTAHLLVSPGDAVVTTRGTYPTLNYFIAGRGGTLHAVPYGKDDRSDLDELCERAWETDAKLLYLCNPDNPSGTWHPADEIEALIENLPPGCLLVIDEAYHELAGHASDIIPQVAADDLRVLRLRTFSKAYGLAGCRIGYAVGAPEIIAAFDKVRNHFGIGRVAQAGALAALGDEAHLAMVQEKVAVGRKSLVAIAEEYGLRTLPSATNFVTIDCGQRGEFARRLLSELLDRDVFVRMPGAPPLNRCIRVTAGEPSEIAIFRAALPAALDAAREKDSRDRSYGVV